MRKKRQRFARKLLPRAATRINPRLAYCFPDQEEIYVRLCAHVHVYIRILHIRIDRPPRRWVTTTTTTAMRKKRLVEGRAFMRAHFVLSSRKWETKESVE